MNPWILIRLELSNYRPYTVLLALGFVAYAGFRVPVEPLAALGRGDLLARASVLAVATFFLAWTFAYLFAGFSAVSKKEHRIYDRYFSFPVPAWKPLLAEACGAAVPAAALAWLALILFLVRSGLGSVALVIALAPVVAAFSVGAASGILALSLRFENPRAPTFGFFSSVGGSAGILWALRRLGGDPAALAGAAVGLALLLSGAGVVALIRVDGRRVVT